MYEPLSQETALSDYGVSIHLLLRHFMLARVITALGQNDILCYTVRRSSLFRIPAVLSLIQISRSSSRFAAWLGLFAIMLLFIAPVISKSLVSAYGDRFMMPGMQHSMPVPAIQTSRDQGISVEHLHQMQIAEQTSHADTEHAISMPGAAAEHARMMVHHPMSMMDDSACGYCVLLAHMPLDLNNLVPLWSALQAAKPPALPLLPQFIPRVVAHFFHPRAPPAV